MKYTSENENTRTNRKSDKDITFCFVFNAKNNFIWATQKFVRFVRRGRFTIKNEIEIYIYIYIYIYIFANGDDFKWDAKEIQLYPFVAFAGNLTFFIHVRFLSQLLHPTL